MTILFDVLHLYYLPQYLPVYDKLKKAGCEVKFVFYRQVDTCLQLVTENIVEKNKLDAVWLGDWPQALQFYLEKQADWIIFGNAAADLGVLHSVSKTALMQHGIGPKSCYYDVSEQPTTVRFVEGLHRLERLQKCYPNDTFVDSGYAKLDAAVNGQGEQVTLSSLGLSEDKPTLLYAPTFYPSSIEKFKAHFAKDFADYNIIIKPHFFSLTKKQYSSQYRFLRKLAESENVYLANVEDYNLLPFMAISDVMLSDASSAIFEFAALNKPVIWCDFYKLRWSYRGPFRFRLNKRLDSDIEYFNKVALRAKCYDDIAVLLKQAQVNPFTERKETIEQLAGKVDGKCSDRIVKYLLENIT